MLSEVFIYIWHFNTEFQRIGFVLCVGIDEYHYYGMEGVIMRTPHFKERILIRWKNIQNGSKRESKFSIRYLTANRFWYFGLDNRLLFIFLRLRFAALNLARTVQTVIARIRRMKLWRRFRRELIWITNFYMKCTRYY